jgi:C4-dicarboxylate-specific signal transduction histidine kinase
MSRVTAMGELTASIAHEIQQPLTGLVTSGHACLRYLTGARDLEAARRAVERMIRDALRAGEVVNRIRAMAKKSPPRKDAISINDIVLETVSLLRTELQRNNISLRTALAEDLPPILGDQIQLQQVVVNLIINAKEAISAAAEGPRKIEVGTDSLGPGQIVLSVHDTGPGLEKIKLTEIFEPFYTTKASGMGMGLAISRSIVEAHSGQLTVTPNQPRGAVFQCVLPVWKADNGSSDPESCRPDPNLGDQHERPRPATAEPEASSNG